MKEMIIVSCSIIMYTTTTEILRRKRNVLITARGMRHFYTGTHHTATVLSLMRPSKLQLGLLSERRIDAIPSAGVVNY